MAAPCSCSVASASIGNNDSSGDNSGDHNSGAYIGSTRSDCTRGCNYIHYHAHAHIARDSHDCCYRRFNNSR